VKAIDRGVHQAASYVADLAAQLAPEKSGALKASGRVEPEAPDGSKEYRVVFGGGAVDYARYVEEGTDNPNYPVQPYLAPAVQQISVKAEIKAAIADLAARSKA
jgi:hypothetical protein